MCDITIVIVTDHFTGLDRAVDLMSVSLCANKFRTK